MTLKTNKRVQMSPMDLAAMLWAFTRLGYEPSHLLSALEALPEAADALQGNTQCCVTLLWCMATFASVRLRLYDAAMRELSLARPHELSTTQLQQIVTSHVLAVSDGCAAPPRPSLPMCFCVTGCVFVALSCVCVDSYARIVSPWTLSTGVQPCQSLVAGSSASVVWSRTGDLAVQRACMRILWR